ncbi:MAG: DUF4129 domain-containing protein [Gemmataceae bacterium]
MSSTYESDRTVADYVASAITPVLIMALIGSLVFFLVEVFYVGQYPQRLLWTFFFYVFGAVLVSRMATQGDMASKAGLYGPVLALLAWIALIAFVKFPPGTLAGEFGWLINLGLVAVIWWSSHKLTMDSTIDEEKEDASGQGLLEVAGIDNDPKAKQEQSQSEPEPEKSQQRRKKKQNTGLTAWMERLGKYREDQKKKPKTHGVWVVYFSLAALPLFGLGQAFIPVEETWSRQYAFMLLAIYVASGLGLLLTTTFLSLRRYLRQKKVRMPLSITTTWLFFGGTLIVVMLVVAAVLPRPYPEYSVVDLIRGQSEKQKASQWAMKGDEPGKGKGNPGQGEKGEKGKQSGKGEKGKGQGQSKDRSGNQGKQKGKGNGGKQKSNQGSGDQKRGKQGGESKQKNQQGQKRQAKDKGEKGTEKDGKASGKQQLPKPSSQPWASWIGPYAKIFKYIVLGILGIIVLLVVLRNLLSFLANFTLWARDLLGWFRSLWTMFGGKESEVEGAEEEEEESVVHHRPLGSFSDPFLTGQAEVMSPLELVKYSFEALEAWARDEGISRQSGETPLEFAERLGVLFPELAEPTTRLVEYYAAAAYAPNLLNADVADDLRQFWLVLMTVGAEPLVGVEEDVGT